MRRWLQFPIKSCLTPPLENGDRLTRAEFERRYAAMPNLKKAELIEGVVYMAAAFASGAVGVVTGARIC
jgi:hypothetical protein